MHSSWTAYAALAALGAAVLGPAVAAAETADFAYIGTYTRDAPGGAGEAQSEGIYVAKVDPESGELALQQIVASENPSFLALSPDQSRLVYSDCRTY